MTLTVSVDEIIQRSKHTLLAIRPHWKRIRLREVASVLNGFAFKSSQFTKGEGTPLIRIRDVGGGSTDTNYVGEFDERYVVEPGELLIGMDGDFNCARWKGPPGLLNQRVCKITLENDQYHPRFLDYALPGYLDAINDATSSVTVKHLSSRTVEDIPLPFPPLAEQDEIVAELEKQFSRLDEAVANLKRVKANLKRYKAAVLKAAVEGRLVPTEAELARREVRGYETGAQFLQRILLERRQSFAGRGKYKVPAEPVSAKPVDLPDGWGWCNVDQLAEVGTGATPKRDQVAYYDGGTIPWVTSAVVNNSIVREALEFVTTRALAETNLTLYPPGTLLVAMYGEGKTRGKCTELRVAATTNQALAALQAAGGVTDYLKLFLEHNYQETRKVASGGVQPNLNLSLVRSVCVPLPPLGEQHRIVAEVDRRLSLVREVEAEVDANLKRAQVLRQVTLQRAFGG